MFLCFILADENLTTLYNDLMAKSTYSFYSHFDKCVYIVAYLSALAPRVKLVHTGVFCFQRTFTLFR